MAADKPQTLDEFADELRGDVEKFIAAYKANHAETPEHYPLVQPANNAGVWFESFIYYCQTGKT